MGHPDVARAGETNSARETRADVVTSAVADILDRRPVGQRVPDLDPYLDPYLDAYLDLYRVSFPCQDMPKP